MKNKVTLSLETYHELVGDLERAKRLNESVIEDTQRIRALLATVIMNNGGTISVAPESFSKLDFMANSPWYISTRTQPTDAGLELILSLHEVER